MDTCFECGGKTKLIAKSGRMFCDEDLLYEIPTELKISTCGECGYLLHDSFTQGKIANSIRAQKSVKPNAKLLQLRWIDKFLQSMLQQPRLFGNRVAVFWQTVLLLRMRELQLSKGLDDKRKEIVKALVFFNSKKWPQMNKGLVYPKDISLEELAPALKKFSDLWINT